VGALRGTSKEELLSDHYSPVEGCWETHPLAPEIREIGAGSFPRKEPPEIRGLGYVVRSLKAALWAFHKSSNFCEGCLLAANLGDDADTTAAVYGQLTGAFYGEEGIPKNWLEKLAMREKIVSFADKLSALSRRADINPSSLRSQHYRAEVHRAADEEVLPVPFDRSYWVVPGRFLAGAYPGDPVTGEAEKKLRLFLDAGIRFFVDLTFRGDRNLFGYQLIPYQDLLGKFSVDRFKVTYRRMPVADLDVPSRDEMREILDLIDGAILSSLPVYVHCLGGIGRTGTVVGCWLVRHGVEQGKGAIDLIRKLRRNEAHALMSSPQTAQQQRFILEWNQGE
jgi:hypothetical protein